MKKTDKERLKKIVAVWNELNTQIRQRNITKEQLLKDEFLQWAVTTPLYNIGEQVYNLSGELKLQYPDVIWSKAAGLRHRLVHDYDGINWEMIVEIIFDEMEPFVESIRQILNEI